MDIHGGSLERGRQTTVGLSKTAIFSTVSSEALVVRPTLVLVSSRRLFADPKMRDLE